MEDGELEQSDDELSIVYLSEGLQGETSTTDASCQKAEEDRLKAEKERSRMFDELDEAEKNDPLLQPGRYGGKPRGQRPIDNVDRPLHRSPAVPELPSGSTRPPKGSEGSKGSSGSTRPAGRNPPTGPGSPGGFLPSHAYPKHQFGQQAQPVVFAPSNFPVGQPYWYPQQQPVLAYVMPPPMMPQMMPPGMAPVMMPPGMAPVMMPPMPVMMPPSSTHQQQPDVWTHPNFTPIRRNDGEDKQGSSVKQEFDDDSVFSKLKKLLPP